VTAFFAALAPAELDVLARASTQRRQADASTRNAQAQQVERLRYRAALVERQFEQVDPDNRLVAAELERRWEQTLRDLHQAEAALAKAPLPAPTGAELSQELRAAFADLGKRLPQLWQGTLLSTARKKALLGCLIDKVVIHRAARDRVRTRIVWRGADVTELEIPITVGSLAELSRGEEMEKRIVKLARAGESDASIARKLSAEGFRSPLRKEVLPSTVRIIRLRHRILIVARQSHPRRITGHLTVPQLAQQLKIERHWIYDRIHNGTIAISRDPRTKLYLFPDKPATLSALRALKSGKRTHLNFDP
jgi:hypothetical protein